MMINSDDEIRLQRIHHATAHPLGLDSDCDTTPQRFLRGPVEMKNGSFAYHALVSRTSLGYAAFSFDQSSQRLNERADGGHQIGSDSDEIPEFCRVVSCSLRLFQGIKHFDHLKSLGRIAHLGKDLPS
jgi:hypothetical protein